MTVKKQLISELKKVLTGLDFPDFGPSVDYPQDAKHGDYSTNIALIAAKKLGKNPMEVGEDFKIKLSNIDFVEKIDVVRPGFINFWIKNEFLAEKLQNEIEIPNVGEGKKVVVEYTDPIPFNEFHIGHLYSNVVGESITRLLEATGVIVWRADYFGDVGMHVAKSLWGLLKKFADDKITIDDLSKKSLPERIAYFGQAYALGATTYEEDESAKEEMKELNFLCFKAAQEIVLSTFNEKPQIDYDRFIKKGKYEYKDIKNLYKVGREWSLAYFETIYARLGTKFDGYYPESRTGEFGYGMVMDGLEKGIFVKGDGGAIIFPGSKHGLHDRVFINSLGLPTYETKDFGNAVAKQKDFAYDQSIIVTGNEINEYFHVIIKALGLLVPELGEKTIHVGHGMVRLPEGKMSSRTGKIKTGESLLDAAKIQAKQLSESEDEALADQIGQAAVKYAFLKSSIGKDIIFDFEESVSFDGNSGPYLQYTFARTQSVLLKAEISNFQFPISNFKLQIEERELLRLLSRFPEVIEEAAKRLSPNILCNYLFELAQAFNLFYQKCPILKAEEETKAFRLTLTKSTGETVKKGLNLLGIKAPEKM